MKHVAWTWGKLGKEEEMECVFLPVTCIKISIAALLASAVLIGLLTGSVWSSQTVS